MLDGLGPLLIVHVVAALVAIVSGAVVFLLPKGTRPTGASPSST